MSVLWHPTLNEVAERLTLEQLDDIGIGFLPEDKSYLTYRRDYPKPGLITEEQFHRLVQGACAVGIIAVCAVLIYSEYFA